MSYQVRSSFELWHARGCHHSSSFNEYTIAQAVMSHLGPTFTAHKHSTGSNVRQSRDGGRSACNETRRATIGEVCRDFDMRHADTVTGATLVLSERFVPVSKAPLLQTTLGPSTVTVSQPEWG